MTWIVPKIWDGGDVWILGGGPSITKQFQIPTGLVQGVLSGVKPLSEYSSYMEPIHTKHVIGINVAFLIGNWIDMTFFGDTNYFLRYKEQMQQFPGLKVSCCPAVTKDYWVKFLIKDTNHIRGISDNPKAVSWNGNSGAAAISVAANTGAKRIFLLGFDMKLDDVSQEQHWHSLYKQASRNERPRKGLPFKRHMVGFPAIAQDAKRRKIEIINVNPGSAIEDFQKVSLSDALKM